MKIRIIDGRFSVCKVSDYSLVDLNVPYCFLADTPEERSLVCPEKAIPENTTARDDGWAVFKIEGVLDFSLIGILADISKVLADEKIGIFAISTYNTDYIMVKEENRKHAVDALSAAGYEII